MNPSVSKDPVNRSAAADILKSLSIIAVVFIHGSQLTSFSPSKLDLELSQVDFLINALRFCVPVFIFLWAYFTERTTLKKGNSNQMSRLYKLLIPFTIWSLLYFFMIADFKQINLSTLISKYWTGYGWAGQYYFIILFQLLILFTLIRSITIRLQRFALVLIILSAVFYSTITYSAWFSIGIIGKLGYRPFFYWIPYVMLGILQAHKNIFSFRTPLLVVLLSPLLILAEVFLLHPSTDNIYMLPSVFVCSMSLLSTIQLKLSYADVSPLLGNVIQTLSNSTLGIFCLNPLVIITLKPLLAKAGFSPQFPFCTVIMPVTSCLLICAVCMLMINVLKRIKLGLLVAN